MNSIKTILLLSLLAVVMVFMGNALGGTTGMVFAFLMACAMTFFSYWFFDKIVLKMSGALEIGEHDHPPFYGMVRSRVHLWKPWKYDNPENGEIEHDS